MNAHIDTDALRAAWPDRPLPLCDEVDRLRAENDALRRLASGRERLLACYRMGTQRSSGTALDMISKAQRDLDALGSDRG